MPVGERSIVPRRARARVLLNLSQREYSESREAETRPLATPTFGSRLVVERRWRRGSGNAKGRVSTLFSRLVLQWVYQRTQGVNPHLRQLQGQRQKRATYPKSAF